MLIGDLEKKGLIDPPPWMATNTPFLAITGSHAYGVADTSVKDKVPDYDIYGWCVPPKMMLFKHLTGWIPGFGPKPSGFDQWQKHKVIDEKANGGKGKEFDFQIFSIVKFFELCRQNNPNLIDVLFVPVNCVVHSTNTGNMVKENRHLFLSKQCWPRFKGYAYSQLHKAGNKDVVKDAMEARKFEEEHNIPHTMTLEKAKSIEEQKDIAHLTAQQLVEYKILLQKGTDRSRFQIAKEKGLEVKFFYHVIRLLSEVEQILLEGDLDLQEKGRREHMKAIRRGEISEENLRQWASDKEKQLEKAYTNCKLPERPPIEPLRQLLYNCLEEHYGSLEGCVVQPGWAESSLREIDELLGKVRRKLYA